VLKCYLAEQLLLLLLLCCISTCQVIGNVRPPICNGDVKAFYAFVGTTRGRRKAAMAANALNFKLHA